MAAQPPLPFLEDRKRKWGMSLWMHSTTHYPPAPRRQAWVYGLVHWPQGPTWSTWRKFFRMKSHKFVFPLNAAEERYLESAHSKKRLQLQRTPEPVQTVGRIPRPGKVVLFNSSQPHSGTLEIVGYSEVRFQLIFIINRRFFSISKLSTKPKIGYNTK